MLPAMMIMDSPSETSSRVVVELCLPYNFSSRDISQVQSRMPRWSLSCGCQQLLSLLRNKE
ncbi:mCG1029387, isoform CRA_b [Mus musculus]|nr:mCG1029387, isoform CRA_b [Mus musculus]